MTTFADLRGMTLAKIEGPREENDSLVFETVEGRRFELYYSQDCCESVSLDDITGNLNDLIGSPLLMAEEVSNADEEPGFVDPHAEEYRESFTWTFYKLATVKGYVTLRWYGESNGCYSESVDFRELPARRN